jgi:hypothetical protein
MSINRCVKKCAVQVSSSICRSVRERGGEPGPIAGVFEVVASFIRAFADESAFVTTRQMRGTWG